MKIGIIGYGNMGESFAKALQKHGEVLVYDVKEERRQKAMSDGFGVARGLQFLAEESQWLLLAVKPKDAPEVLKSLKGRLEEKILVSIVAGLSLAKMEEFCKSSRLIRLMPNINALVGRSATACAFGKLKEEEKRTFFELFSNCGSLYELEEDMFDAFTALAGSGPAFVFKFVHALALAGVREGFPYEMAKSLAIDVVFGSCELLRQKGGSPEDWVVKVASPGGTTIEGIKVLEEEGFTGMVMECVQRTSEKAKKLL
ncbi:MAG: pyrroline-5-carboxylate reductase [Aquificaceae bacterium]|nr:pyrroline-5-carboxylate reductase [Aquificaceae bacterium]